VKKGGTDSSGCTTYGNACDSISYVLTSVVNKKSGDYTVYVDSGTYVYNTGFAYTSSTGFNNFIVNLTGYVAASHVSSDDIITYPLISVAASNNYHYIFYLYSNVNFSFCFLRFFIDNSGGLSLYLIASFFFYLYFYFYI
jgi:hypothetical protein